MFNTEQPPIREVVTGPPASGKTYHVTHHSVPGAFRWDADVIADVVFGLPAYPRPQIVARCIAAMLDAAIRTIARYPIDMRIISTDEAKAAEIAASIGGVVRAMECSEDERQCRLIARNGSQDTP